MSAPAAERAPRIRGARRLTVSQRLYRSTDTSGPCHLWQGSTTKSGYGQISHNGRRVLVHRLAWQLAGGAIPDGYTLDHLCGHKPCVCLWHLRLATAQQQARNKPGRPDYSVTDVEGVFFMGRWETSHQRWRAVLSGGGTAILLGHWRERESAVLALEEAAAGYQLPLPGMGLSTDVHEDGPGA